MAAKCITIRVSDDEYQELSTRAKRANTSMNRYLIESGLGATPRNDKALSDLMGQLCRLEICMQKAADLPGLKREIRNWKQVTMQMMEGYVWQ